MLYITDDASHSNYWWYGTPETTEAKEVYRQLLFYGGAKYRAALDDKIIYDDTPGVEVKRVGYPNYVKKDTKEEEPVIVNDKGGKQSDIKYDYTLIPGDAMEHIAQSLTHGCNKYGRDNWRLIPRQEHVSHALRHTLLWCVHRKDEDLRNAATRLLFALSTNDNDGKPKDNER